MTVRAQRWGLTVPLEGVPLAEQAEVAREAEALGWTDLWSSEGTGTDGFTPLAVAAAVTAEVRLGIAIAPVFTRGPALLAQTAATLAATAPGRFVLGIGSSSNVIVERFNDIPFDKPWSRTRDTLHFLRLALAGEHVDREFETFAVRGFRSAVPLTEPVPILVAGLRPRMLSLAGSDADGAVVNWLSAEDVRRVSPLVRDGHPDREIVARVMVAPTDDAEQARALGRRLVAAYLNVPVYRAFHEWLERPGLEEMWRLWAEGDRKGALAAIPDRVVDDLVVHGPPEAICEHLERYAAHGADTPVAYLLPVGRDPREAMRELAPR